MNFEEHSRLKGCHAFLGASSYHWLNYSDEKLITTYSNLLAKERGSKLHEFAAMAIELGVKLPRTKKTLNMYVNDAIGFRMKPEQVLYYSDNCFGTADAISFKNNFLRIHDLKTGVTPAKMEQLMIYAALFCLEYRIKPQDIDIELRIYQNDDYEYFNPTAEHILPIMDKIITFDKLIDKIRSEEV
jgi:hypothetical protein